MADIILPWDGEHASIPASWTRYTAWDGKYPKASSADLDGTGGNATHTHTSPTHTHTYTSNSHTHTSGTTSQGGNAIKTDARHQDAPADEVSTIEHTHSSVTSGSFITPNITTEIAAIGTATNEYSRYHFVFIKGSVFTPLPASAVVMRNDIDARAGSTHFDFMDGRYMKGAATDGNAGSGTDVTTHTHTQSHAHTISHDHNNVSSGSGGGNLGSLNISSGSMGNHTHTLYFAAYSADRSNTTNVTAATADLSYRELHFWKTSSQQVLKTGDIALSIEASTPVGWTDMGWDDVYIKGKSDGGALSTGGANTHTHAELSHNHAGISHTHTYTSSSVGGSVQYRNGGDSSISGTHSHTGTTSASTDATTGTASATFSTDNIEPLYVKAKYIEFQYPPVLPNPILNMLIDRVENN